MGSTSIVPSIMELTALNALSPLDGRYQAKLDALRPCFSEWGLIRQRAHVEIEWLKALAAEPAIAEVPPFSTSTLAELDAVIAGFGELEASEVKAIEATTNHDVKALEYWLKEKFTGNPEVQRGSHKQFRNAQGRCTTVPFHTGRDISPLLLRQIAKDIGMTVEEFVSKR